MKEMVEFLVKSLADHPDEVLLEEHGDEESISLELKIASDDVGRIIGKNGNTINAIRTVLQAAAASHKKRARLEIAS